MAAFELGKVPQTPHVLPTVYTNTISTNSWATGTFYPVIPANTLDWGVYKVIIQYDKSGTDNLMITLDVPIYKTDSGQGQQTTLFSSNYCSYVGSTSNFFLFRSLKGSATLGLEASPNVSALAGGTMIITVYRY